MMRRGRLQIVAVIVLVAVLVGYGLATHFIAPLLYSAAHNRPIGANVTVTGSKVPNSMKATEIAANQTVGHDFQPLGSTIQITPGGALPAPVTLTFKLPRQLAQGDVALLATSESSSGGWSFVPTTVSRDGWYATVQTTHLSRWSTWLFDVKQATVDFLKQLAAAASSDLSAQADKPHCDNEDQARQDDYIIKSDAKNTVYWCLGFENGQRVLKIVNRERYPLELTHPRLSVLKQAGPNLSLDQLARFGSGATTILYPFEEVDYAVNFAPGYGTLVTTSLSGFAQSLSQLQFGVTTLINILALYDGDGGGIGTGALSKDSWIRTANAMDKIMSLNDCLQSMMSLDTGGFVVHCFQWDELKKAFGWKGVLLAPVTLVTSVINYFLTQFNIIVDQVTGASDYRILVGRNQPASSPSTGGTTSSTLPNNPPPNNPPPANNPPPVNPPPTTPQSIQIAWSSAYATYIAMTLNGFPTGSYQYTCAFGSGGNQTFTLNESTSPQTWDNGHTCYDAIAGDTVWVVVNGVKSNVLTVASSSPPPPPPPPATTYPETAGGNAHTWTNYLNAGGTQGPTVPAYATIQIACRLTGFKVADGNTWWYRIAQSPWSNQYYVSADAFYNNGQTSGGLSGTPFYDPNVPGC